MLFGAKSEKLVRQVAQLELQLEELEISRGEEEESAPLPFHELAKEEPKQAWVVPCPNTCRARSRRIALRQAAALAVEERCASSAKMSLEVLEYVPESLKVVCRVRPKFSCGRCETMVEATPPSRPIPRSYADPAARAWAGGEVLRSLSAEPVVGDLMPAKASISTAPRLPAG